MSLESLFASYQASLGTPRAGELRNLLFPECQKAALPVRRLFTASDRVDGDVFDDAVVSVFLKLTEPDRAREIEPSGFKSYFCRAVHHALVDVVREVVRHPHVSLDGLEYRALIEEHAPTDLGVIRQKLMATLKELSPVQLDAFSAYLSGKKYCEIAKEQGVPLGTVKSRIRQAHEAMQKHPKLMAELSEYHGAELAGLEEIVPELHAERVRRGKGERGVA